MNSSENGSRKKAAILDTNVIYSALHKPQGVCGQIVVLGAESSVKLYSPDFAMEELRRNLGRKMGMDPTEVELVISSLPVEWIPKVVYSEHLDRAVEIVGNKQDAVFVAVSLATGIPLISGDRHIQTKKVRRAVAAHTPRSYLDQLKLAERREWAPR